jgi:hypothetical protein
MGGGENEVDDSTNLSVPLEEINECAEPHGDKSWTERGEREAAEEPSLETEDDDGSLIDVHLAELKKLRTQRIWAVTEEVFSQVIRELSSEGVDIDESELSLMVVLHGNRHLLWDSSDFAYGPSVPEIPTLLEFIGTAIASGIVGNLAYDALKGVLRRVSSRRNSAPVTEQLEGVVLFAVAEMCRRFQLHVDPSRLRVRQWQHGEKGVVAIVGAKGSELTAEVSILYDRWRTDGVSVRIQDVSESAAIARVAKSVYREKYQHDTDPTDDVTDADWRSETAPWGVLKYFREQGISPMDLMPPRVSPPKGVSIEELDHAPLVSSSSDVDWDQGSDHGQP